MLDEIDQIANRVRQSLFYHRASLIIILWGALTFVGYSVNQFTPQNALATWKTIYVVGTTISVAIGAFRTQGRVRRHFDPRLLVAFVLFFAFGYVWTQGIGAMPPRQLSAFWASYFMLAYTILGLWLGVGLLSIGLGIMALTFVGYLFAGPWFDLWMAIVNGGGLVLGGFWMRRA